MKHYTKLALVSGVLFGLLSVSAFAQRKGSIKLLCTAHKEIVVVNDAGERQITYTSVAVTLPGDVIRYTLTYNHIGDEPATSVVIINPIPESTFYIADSAGGEDMEISFSIDGGKAYGKAKELKVIGPGGVSRLALPAEYTHVRWELLRELEKGESGIVFFKVRIK